MDSLKTLNSKLLSLEGRMRILSAEIRTLMEEISKALSRPPVDEAEITRLGDRLQGLIDTNKEIIEAMGSIMTNKGGKKATKGHRFEPEVRLPILCWKCGKMSTDPIHRPKTVNDDKDPNQGGTCYHGQFR